MQQVSAVSISREECLYAESSPVNMPHVSCPSHVSIWEKKKDANKMEG